MVKREIEKREMSEQQHTINEREERLRLEKEREQSGEEIVNFTLFKPHPQFIYHTHYLERMMLL